jgi:hypothetical protein
MPLVIDNNTTTQQPAPAVQQNYQPAQSAPLIQQLIPGAQQGFAPEQQAMMHERARVFAQELVRVLGQRAPLAVAGQTNANGINGNATTSLMLHQ